MFVVELIIAFFVGGGYVALVTRISERFGSKIGGILTGAPSIVLVGLSFIAISQGANALVKATTVAPAAISCAGILLVVFRLMHRFGVLVAYLSAVSAWLILALPLAIFRLPSIWIAFPLGIVVLSISLIYFRNQPHSKLQGIHFGWSILIARGLAAGILVVFAVVLAKLLGPIWGSLASSFPIVFSTTLIIFEKAYGIDFTASVARSMCFGAASNMIFTLGVFLFVPIVGVVIGLVAAYMVSLFSALTFYRYALE